MNLCYTNSLKQSRFSSIDGKKGAPKRDRMFVVFILSNVFELHARLVTPLTFEPITSAVIWKIHYSNLCIKFGTWWERRMNQPPLQRRIVRQTLPNLMLFAAPNRLVLKHGTLERRNARTPERRNAGTPERRNAGTPERRNAGILKPGTQNY